MGQPRTETWEREEKKENFLTLSGARFSVFHMVWRIEEPEWTPNGDGWTEDRLIFSPLHVV